jgi:hypothetical protein
VEWRPLKATMPDLSCFRRGPDRGSRGVFMLLESF